LTSCKFQLGRRFLKQPGAKLGRRFLKQPAEKLKAVFVAFDKERRIPAVGASTEDVDIN